jgi:hypothetical protein
MRNKRGFIFGLVLVFVTLFLSASVVLLYIHGQRNSDNSLVSPRVVLEVRDDLELFEMREVELIRESLVSADGDFVSSGFIDSFRELFVDGVMSDERMKDFLFEDLISVDGANVEGGDKNRNLVEVGIYPERLTKEEDGGIIFARTAVEKGKFLVADDSSKINFPVGFGFEFERAYVITFENSKFLVDGE